MDEEDESKNLLLQILEHLLATGPGRPPDFGARIACVPAYARLCSLNPDRAIDRNLTAASGALYKIHLSANPESFLSQLILPILTHADLAAFCDLVSALNSCLQDGAIRGSVKFSILNVENMLLRNAVIVALPSEGLALGRQFCAIRRSLVLDSLDNSLAYFPPELSAANESVLPALYGLYVDTERDLLLRVCLPNAIMPFIEDQTTAMRHRAHLLPRVLRSAIVANQRAALITAESMRETLDRCREWLTGDDITQLDRMIDMGDGGQDDEVRDVTIELAHPTFRGTTREQVYTQMRFVLPFEFKPNIPEATWCGDSPVGRCRVTFHRISSMYEDPLMLFLANIGSDHIAHLPSHLLSDVNPAPSTSSTLVSLAVDACMALDFDIAPDGETVERACDDERALRGGRYFPYKEEAIRLLRHCYRQTPGQFPLACQLNELHIDSFSNILVEFLVKPARDTVGDVLVHHKISLLTSRDSLARARARHASSIGELYRQDHTVGLKAVFDNLTVRTNDSLRVCVYKTLELTVKDCVERHSCWSYLWEEVARRPKSETNVHPFINAHLRSVLELKGIRVSREPRMANGAVDFFCSYTTPRDDVLKVCVEVKNAHSEAVEAGVASQLPEYMDAEHTHHGIYLVMWYKGAEWARPTDFSTVEELLARLDAVKPRGDYHIDVMIVECTKPTAPSQLRKLPDTSSAPSA